MLGGAVGAAVIAIGLATGTGAIAAPTPAPVTFEPNEARGNPWLCIDRGYLYGYTVAQNIPNSQSKNTVTTTVEKNGSNVLGKDTPENANQTITLTSVDGINVAWQTNFDIGAVIVKGSDTYNQYTYNPAAQSDGQAGDGGMLTTPPKNNGTYPKINQVTLCWGTPPPPPPKLGSITITKNVTGALPNDPHTFDFTITEAEDGVAPEQWESSNFSLVDGETKTIYGIAAGTRNILRESLGDKMPAGYDFDRLDCSLYSDIESYNDGDTPIGPAGTIAANEATLDITDGQHVHCVYTNEQLPQLVVTKTVLGPDDKDDTPFPFTLDGKSIGTLAHGEQTTDPIYLTSDADHVLTEGDLPAGYGFDNVACTLPEREPWPAKDQVTAAEAPAPVTYDQAKREATINVPAGTLVECAYTNLKLPTLTVIKNVVNDDDGTLKPSDFEMKVTGTNVSDDSFAGSDAGTTVTLSPGEYSVDEVDPRGYTKTLGDDCSGTIAAGEDLTCIITNDDVAPETPETPEVPETPQNPETPQPENTPQTPVAATAEITPVAAQGIATRTRPALTRLAITKTGPRRANALQRFSYTIKVRNAGKAVARSVRMRDALPAGLIPVSTNIASTQRGRVVIVQLGNLRPGQVRTIRVTVRAAASIKGRKINIAVARAANAAPVRDEAPTVFAPLVRQIAPAVTG
jgi:uncharacterized repeat protein (TIGR01451 family)